MIIMHCYHYYYELKRCERAMTTNIHKMRFQCMLFTVSTCANIRTKKQGESNIQTKLPSEHRVIEKRGGSLFSLITLHKRSLLSVVIMFENRITDRQPTYLPTYQSINQPISQWICLSFSFYICLYLCIYVSMSFFLVWLILSWGVWNRQQGRNDDLRIHHILISSDFYT